MNILICGSTGVGKSTLINAIGGKKLAETSSNTACTMKVTGYQINGITYFDTRGLELKGSKEIMKIIQSLVTKKNSQKDPNDYIHLAYVCIDEQSERYDSTIESLVTFLNKQMNLPVIIILTKAYFPGATEFSGKLKTKFPSCDVVRVNSEDIEFGDWKAAKSGLDELEKLTLAKVPEAQRRAYATVERRGRGGLFASLRQALFRS